MLTCTLSYRCVCPVVEEVGILLYKCMIQTYGASFMSRDAPEELVVLKYPNFRLKICDVANRNRKLRYFSPTGQYKLLRSIFAPAQVSS